MKKIKKNLKEVKPLTLKKRYYQKMKSLILTLKEIKILNIILKIWILKQHITAR